MMNRQPTDAIVAVTLNCNARCIMCDIWKNEIKDEMQPEEYRKLPSSLKSINVTGGEPFLRKDLPEIIRVIKETCHNAKLVISSHGFMSERIKQLMPQILNVDPDIGVRISIDGLDQTHDAIRGIAGGYKRDMLSLKLLRELGVRDLGIAMTVMNSNVDQLPKIYRLSNEMKIQFTVTIATDSEGYFGKDKVKLRPHDQDVVRKAFMNVVCSEYCSWYPKRWFRAWFEKKLLDYTLGQGRPLPCDAGQGFFYLDSRGYVSACHIIPTQLGSLRIQDWSAIWESFQANRVRKEIVGCEQCWMVCTAKSQARQKLVKIGLEVLRDKIRAHSGLL
jgi:MoaA/NifB/PqqE/SkfB family radical SAM enzyme